METKRTLPVVTNVTLVVTSSRMIPFTQAIQCSNLVTVPTQSGILLQPQDLYLLRVLNLSQVMYATSSSNTPDGHPTCIVEMDNLSWCYSM